MPKYGNFCKILCMKKLMYGIFGGVAIAGLALLLVFLNINDVNAQPNATKIHINCAREISIFNSSKLKLEENAVTLNDRALSDFSISITPKSEEYEGGLVYENGVFSAKIVGNYTVTFSIKIAGEEYRDNIVIVVEENNNENSVILYIDSPQDITEIINADELANVSFLYDDECIDIVNDTIVPVEVGETYLDVIQTYTYFKILNEIDINVISTNANKVNVFNYTFIYEENNGYSLQFTLEGGTIVTNQDLISIDYDESKLVVFSFDSPFIHFTAKEKCETTITLTFSSLDAPVELVIKFI